MAKSYDLSREVILVLKVIVKNNFPDFMKISEKSICPGDEIPERLSTAQCVSFWGVGSSSLNQVIICKFFNSINI